MMRRFGLAALAILVVVCQILFVKSFAPGVGKVYRPRARRGLRTSFGSRALITRGTSLSLGSTSNDVEVGSQVVGEVFEHDMDAADPRIYFNVKSDHDENMKGYMSTRNLGWQERMTLHIGAVINAYVLNNKGGELQLGLDPSGDGGEAPPQREQGESRRGASTDDNGGAIRKNPNNLTFPTRSSSKGSGGSVQGVGSGQVLLNNLKTGMALEGEIASCTQYAAFVDAGVVRGGKGGTRVRVNGMLHQNDMPSDYVISRSNNRRSKRDRDAVEEEEPDYVVTKGKKITVYVKEVYKNSGRISYTLNPTIDKAHILAERAKTKQEGNDRRRARRLRRILEDIAVGDTVTGTVDRVVAEGVLVSFSTFGPLPVVGLMSKRDLPRQFQIPPDLKDSFQKQLLEQDFVAGREVTCGVYRVNNKSGPRIRYNLKLTFEEFGALPSDEVSIPDSALPQFGSPAASLDDDEDDEEEDGADVTAEAEVEAWEDDDTREIYDELRGDQAMMTAQDLLDWADVQDMVSSNELSLNQITEAVREASGKAVKPGKADSVKLAFPQFAEIISIMQDALDGGKGGSGSSIDQELLQQYIQAGDEEDEEEEDAGMQISASLADEDEEDDYEDEDEDEDEDREFDESLIGSIEDEAVEEVAREIFESLAGSARGSLSFESVQGWGDIQEMLSSEYISEDDLAGAWQKASGGKDTVQFEQFFSLVQLLEDIAAENDSGDADGSYEDEDEDEDEEGDDEYGEVDEEEEEQMLAEIFEDLSMGKKTITLTTLRKWDELAQLSLEKEEVLRLLKEAGVKVDAKGRVSGGVSQEQFVSFVRCLDPGAEEEEEGEGAALSAAEVLSRAGIGMDGGDKDEDDELLDMEDTSTLPGQGSELTEEENEEIVAGLFNQLRGDAVGVSVRAFLGWEDVGDLISEGLLEQSSVMALIAETGVDTSTPASALMSLAQFSEVVNMLDDTLEALESGAIEASLSLPTGSGAGISDIDEDEDEEDEEDQQQELNEEELRQLAREIFDELRGNAKSLPVKKFKKWEEVAELVSSGAVQADTIDSLIRAVTGAQKATVLSFDHFQQLVSLLDEAGEAAFASQQEQDQEGVTTPEQLSRSSLDSGEDEDEDEDEDDYEPSEEELEAIALEIFGDLRSEKTGKVTIKKFRNWAGVKDVLKTGELTEAALTSAIAAVDSESTGNLDFGQFSELMDRVEDAMDEAEAEEQGLAGGGSGEASDTGKGFAKASVKAVEMAERLAAAQEQEQEEGDADEIARMIFDELRGHKQRLSVSAFKGWEDVQDMVKNGQLKRSTLERAINKAGALESGEMTFAQFSSVINSIQKDVDQAALISELERGPAITSKGTVMSVDEEDEYGDIDEEDGPGQGGMEEMDADEEIRAIYDELRGDRESLPLVEFLKWEDVQELLDVEAISKDTLAECIENVGLSVEDGNLSHDQFKDLVSLLDELVDTSKLLLEGEDMSLDLGYDDEDEDEDEDVSLPLAAGGGAGADQSTEKEDDDLFSASDLLDDDEEAEAQEVKEMFADLSEGRGEISQKQLRKWDELQELVDAGLTNKATIDGYIDRLDLAEGEAVTFEKFTEFISYLDRVLLEGLDDEDLLE